MLLKPSQWAIDRIAEYRNLKRNKFLLPFEIRSKGKPVIKRMKSTSIVPASPRDVGMLGWSCRGAERSKDEVADDSEGEDSQESVD